MTQQREITPAILRELFDYNPETGKLFWKPRRRDLFPDDRSFAIWHAQWPGTEALTADSGTGYKTGLLWGKKLRAHRVAWAIVHGEWPDLIDHINHNRSDNRIANLRTVSHQANARNQGLRRANKSGRSGVAIHLGRWRAVGWVNGKLTQLAWTDSFEDACSARDLFEAEQGYHKNHGT